MAFNQQNFFRGSNICPQNDLMQSPCQFYLIKYGKVRETHQFPRLNNKGTIEFEKQARILDKNDFLGVVACMSSRPWLSTTEVLEDTSTIVIGKGQFASVYQSFPDIIFRIISYFSDQLRNYNERLAKIKQDKFSGKQKTTDLFDLGEFYFGNWVYDKALYAFSSYLRNSPQGERLRDANIRLSQLKLAGTSLVPPQQTDLAGGGLPRRDYPDNSIVFLEGETDDKFYIVEEGSVAIKKFTGENEKLLAVLKKGDFLGEMAVLDHKPRSASAFTIGKTSLTVVHGDKFNAILKNPALSGIIQRLMETICERIWIASQQLFDCMLSNPIERIYATLSTEYARSRSTEAGFYAFNFGLDKLLEFIDVEDKYEGIRALYGNNRVFSAGELLRDLGFSSAVLQNNHCSEEQIFNIYNGRLACMDILKLITIRQQLVDEASKR